MVFIDVIKDAECYLMSLRTGSYLTVRVVAVGDLWRINCDTCRLLQSDSCHLLY